MGEAISLVEANTEPERSERNIARRRLDCGTVCVEVASDDASVIDFTVEYFHPWFRLTERPADWLVTLSCSSSAYAEMQHRPLTDAAPHPCFAHDRQVLSLPAWRSGDSVIVADAERSCFLTMRTGHIDVIGDPRTRRWRFTLLWILLEIAATRLRRTHVDVHAASVENAERALLVAGPKGAGKTTVSFYLMRSCGWRSIANDRSMVSGDAAQLDVVGVPTAVKIPPSLLAGFPDLRAGLPRVARPYLYTLAELATAPLSDEPVDAVDFALTPNQVALRLGSATRPSAPLGAIVFPQVCEDEPAWALEPVASEEVVTGINTNLYGAAAGDRPPTLFEQIGGGQHGAPHRRIAAVASAVKGYRLRLGRRAYADRTLGEGLLRLLAS